MEKDCHNRGVEKGNVLSFGLVKASKIPFRSRDDRFYRYMGVKFTLGLLNCDRYIGDIVITWIVKSGFLFHTFYCNTGQAEKC